MAIDPALSDVLREAIKEEVAAESQWVETVAVADALRRETPWEGWDGAVHVFDLIDHKTAKRCYAWSYPAASATPRLCVVVGSPPIVDVVSAVESQMAADAL